ncbi:hypothetical protein [Aliiruegeria sabulilitoris]|uniref:hypothetical protein n=1 Tax=Aliiruegeria sabulilitoris TaxID=1510458 RepID=UPI001E495F08|nr:hypothetical protein [Aliiruegeria sabulilitoris]
MYLVSSKFRLAVSADGSNFFDGLSVDNANGIVDQPRLLRFKAYTNFDNYGETALSHVSAPAKVGQTLHHGEGPTGGMYELPSPASDFLMHH